MLFSGDTDAVDLGAVGGAEVDDDETTAERADLGVTAADVGVVERDGAIGKPADGDDLTGEAELLTRGHDQCADTNAVAGLPHAGHDFEPARFEGVVDHERMALAP